jgi:hypothetical protein
MPRPRRGPSQPGGPPVATPADRADDRQCPKQHDGTGGQPERRLAQAIDDGEERDRQAEDENGSGQTAR